MQDYDVTELQIFGSVARGDDFEDSDIDILVSMPPKITLVTALHEYLEKLLNRTVDLIRFNPRMSKQLLERISNESIRIL
ncbi:MAG: nucleotidyltransferase domain-containing protein [Muribaculaceae bacterium]|nr:nucleotidyltransferase domain-containing protein [Muribaculaceae bacterium]